MALTITIPGGNVQLSGNKVLVNVVNSRTNVSDQYTKLKITCTSGNISGGPWTDSICGTNVQFDLMAIVDAPLKYEFDIDGGFDHSRDALFAEFTLEAGESFVDTDDEYQEVWPAEAVANISTISGGLNKLELARLNYLRTNFYNHYIVAGRFLSEMNYATTEQEKEIVVNDITHPVKMWYIVSEQPPTSMKVLWHFTDGTEYESTIPWWTVNAKKIVELNLHEFAQEEFISPHDTKTIQWYKASIVTGGVANANCKVIVTGQYTETHEELYIRTRLSPVEVINCYGEVAEKITTNKETYTKSGSDSLSIFERTVNAKKGETIMPFIINTGFKTLTERRWIKQLLENEEAWLKSERLPPLGNGKNYGFAPVIISPGSFDIDTSSDDLMNIEIEVQIAHVN